MPPSASCGFASVAASARTLCASTVPAKTVPPEMMQASPSARMASAYTLALVMPPSSSTMPPAG